MHFTGFLYSKHYPAIYILFLSQISAWLPGSLLDLLWIVIQLLHNVNGVYWTDWVIMTDVFPFFIEKQNISVIKGVTYAELFSKFGYMSVFNWKISFTCGQRGFMRLGSSIMQPSSCSDPARQGWILLL